ncbi:MAG: hypothetical protein RBR15_15560 [Sphaerochaeta sp.]|nr:hypothetical protein [Sphaerochaeta sp.]
MKNEKNTRVVGNPVFDKAVNDFTNMIIEAHLMGKRLDVGKVCKATGMGAEEAERILHMFEDTPGISFFDSLLEKGRSGKISFGDKPTECTFEIADIDKPYQLSGWPLPAQYDRAVLDLDLIDSDLFECNESEEVEKLFSQVAHKAFVRDVHEFGVLDCIAELFVPTFGRHFTLPLMNTFFWILYYKGGQWTSVRSYAIEVAKWIPSSIIPHYLTQDAYIQKFSTFVKKVLCNRAICTIQTRPTPDEVRLGLYRIKATEAFYAMLKPAEIYLF